MLIADSSTDGRREAAGRRGQIIQSNSVTSTRMMPASIEKVLENLATTDKSTLVCEKASEGKIRVTSGSWDG
jgi:hypothetical protein